MGWTLPTDIMTKIARDHVQSWIPDQPNAVRVRYSGGTKGPTGEYSGRVEERQDISIAIFRKRKDKDEQRSGDKFTEDFTAVFNDDLLKQNDVVEWQGLVLEVDDLGEPELNGEVVFRRATLRKKQR